MTRATVAIEHLFDSSGEESISPARLNPGHVPPTTQVGRHAHTDDNLGTEVRSEVALTSMGRGCPRCHRMFKDGHAARRHWATAKSLSTCDEVRMTRSAAGTGRQKDSSDDEPISPVMLYPDLGPTTALTDRRALTEDSLGSLPNGAHTSGMGGERTHGTRDDLSRQQAEQVLSASWFFGFSH